MKLTGFALLLTAVAVHGDILSNTSPFLRPGGPNYSPEGLDSSAGLIDPQYAPFSPADSDLGVQEILVDTPQVAPVNAMIGVDLHYTDNAPAETRALQDKSFLFSTYLGVSWQPHIANGWFADIGLNQEFYEFDQGDALDFQNSLPYIGVVKNIVDLDDTIFFARYEYQRITTGSASDSDYFAQRVRTGLQKTLWVTPRQQLSAGISAAFDIDAGPEALERKEYAIQLSHNYAFTDKLTLSSMARSAIWNFDEAGREDTLHIVGMELIYNLNDNATLSTGVYYTQNDSNTALGLNDSESWQGGLSIGMNLSF